MTALVSLLFITMIPIDCKISYKIFLILVIFPNQVILVVYLSAHFV